MVYCLSAGGAAAVPIPNDSTSGSASSSSSNSCDQDNHRNDRQQHLQEPPNEPPPQQQSSVMLTIDQAIDCLGGGGRFQRRLLWAVGMCNGVNAMAVMVISFLHQTVKVQWDLSTQAASLLASSVFVGIMAGTFILGPLGDSMGRKPVFLVATTIVAVCGIASAFSPNYMSLIVLRFCVGFGVGGTVIPFDIMAEFCPTQQRGTRLLYLGYFWTVGTSATPLMAYFAFQQAESWRLLLIFSSVPSIISSLFGWAWVPESPLWLLEMGRREDALEVLRQAAVLNGQDPDELFPLESTILVTDDEEDSDDSDNDDDMQEGHGEHNTTISNRNDHNNTLNNNNNSHAPNSSNFSILFLKEWRKPVLCFLGVWLFLDFIYWGTIQVVTLAFAEFDGAIEDVEDLEDGAEFQYDYSAIFLTSMAEIVGQTIVMLLIERVGRVYTQVVPYFLGGLSVLALCLVCHREDIGIVKEADRATLVALSFIARMLIMGATSVTWVHAAELLPTPIRNTAHAMADALAGLGGICSPWVVTPTNSKLWIGFVMASVCTACSALIWMLPETTGIPLGTAMSRRSFAPLKDVSETSSQDSDSTSTTDDTVEIEMI